MFEARSLGVRTALSSRPPRELGVREFFLPLPPLDGPGAKFLFRAFYLVWSFYLAWSFFTWSGLAFYLVSQNPKTLFAHPFFYNVSSQCCCRSFAPAVHLERSALPTTTNRSEESVANASGVRRSRNKRPSVHPLGAVARTVDHVTRPIQRPIHCLRLANLAR